MQLIFGIAVLFINVLFRLFTAWRNTAAPESLAAMPGLVLAVTSLALDRFGAA